MALVFIQRDCYLLAIIVILAICRGEPYSENGKSSRGSHNQLGSTPIFITKNNTRVIAQRGGVAVLPCAVKWNPSATVSWIRRRDFQLLTVGLSTYSSDDRFLVEHARHMGHWSLRIKSVRNDDRGFYECQLSIHPTQSIFVELRVVEAIADISGAPDLHIDEGSTLRLECKLKRATENPSFVFWYHDTKMVNYDKQDGFSVSPLPGAAAASAHHKSPTHSAVDSGGPSAAALQSMAAATGATTSTPSAATMNSSSPNYRMSELVSATTSVLTIQEVHFKHAGNYTCAPSNARQASITVHVLRGEKPAAMQHANRSTVDEGKSSSSQTSHYCKYHRYWFLTLLHLIPIFNKINR